MTLYYAHGITLLSILILISLPIFMDSLAQNEVLLCRLANVVWGLSCLHLIYVFNRALFRLMLSQ